MTGGGEATLPCPVCAGASFRPRFARFGRAFVSCRGCGLLQINPPPTDEEIERLYTRDYYRSWGTDAGRAAAAAMKIRNFDDRLRALERHLPGGRILDVGCATGFFLDAARARGWDARGVELSAYAAGVARERHGERVFTGHLAEAAYPASSFDALFMSDLVEHVRDLPAFLAEVRRIVRDGGLAAIITPDAGSLSCRLLGARWPNVKLEHLWYFSRPTLARLLGQYGFRIVETSAPRKWLSVAYLRTQFETYPDPLLGGAVALAARLLPARLRERPVPLPTGELFAIARKEG